MENTHINSYFMVSSISTLKEYNEIIYYFSSSLITYRAGPDGSSLAELNTVLIMSS